MRLKTMGRPVLAALTLSLAPLAASAATLTIAAPDRVLYSVDVAEGQEWCLRWFHSVTHGKVADCFVNDHGHMMLEKSYLHDFAAGLGEVLGRGHLVNAEGRGYWIEDIDERISDDTLILRVGHKQVAHHVTIGDRDLRLSDRAAGERVTLSLKP